MTMTLACLREGWAASQRKKRFSFFRVCFIFVSVTLLLVRFMQSSGSSFWSCTGMLGQFSMDPWWPDTCSRERGREGGEGGCPVARQVVHAGDRIVFMSSPFPQLSAVGAGWKPGRRGTEAMHCKLKQSDQGLYQRSDAAPPSGHQPYRLHHRPVSVSPRHTVSPVWKSLFLSLFGSENIQKSWIFLQNADKNKLWALSTVHFHSKGNPCHGLPGCCASDGADWVWWREEEGRRRRRRVLGEIAGGGFFAIGELGFSVWSSYCCVFCRDNTLNGTRRPPGRETVELWGFSPRGRSPHFVVSDGGVRALSLWGITVRIPEL